MNIKHALSTIASLALISSLPLWVFIVQNPTRTLLRASGQASNVTIDVGGSIGPMPEAFRAFAQGGEETSHMLRPVLHLVRPLRPNYIRLDHIYDFYDVVNVENGTTRYDFSNLDAVVDDIQLMGAIPLLSLSYMPEALSSDGTIVGLPQEWEEWENLVEATIQHYSGMSQRNIPNVYYEVWNEPDLFGRFTIGGAKDYTQLYAHTAAAASRVDNAQPYFFGGPAVTHPTSGWLRQFLLYVQQSGVRLDFISWHRYSINPLVYKDDIVHVEEMVKDFPRLQKAQLLITEWGPDSEVSPINDSVQAAAFTIASVRKMIDAVDYAYAFEIKDGPGPGTTPFWGRWGLITHNTTGSQLKPRYHAFRMLSQLQGERLHLTGEGTWVSAIASRKDSNVTTVISNYDAAIQHSESVPVTFQNVPIGEYIVTQESLEGVLSSTHQIIQNGTFTMTAVLPPNAIQLITLQKIGDFTTSAGQTNTAQDKSIILDGKVNALQIESPAINSLSSTVSFSLKPGWDATDTRIRTIWRLPYSTSFGGARELAVRVMPIGFTNRLVFGVFQGNSAQKTVSMSINGWQPGQWHDVAFAWDSSTLSMTVDGVTETLSEPTNIGLGTVLTFEANDSAIDNLKITDKGALLYEKTFDKR